MALENQRIDQHRLSVVAVWVLTTVVAVLIGALGASGERAQWLGLVAAASILATLCIQLGIHQKEGFVNRVMASIVGAAVVLAAATALLLAVGG